MDYINISDNANLSLEIDPASKWIWKFIISAGLCMSVAGGFIYFSFKGDSFFSEGTLSIFFSIFIIGIICFISGMIPYKFLSSYYIINKRMKQIIHYEKFFHTEWLKNVIYFNDIKKIEIQGKETYSSYESSHSYTKEFWISLILKDGRELKLSNEQSEILHSEIITEKNVEDVSFHIDYEKIKPIFCKKYSYKGDVIDDLYNLNFTKEEIIQLLYLPPEKLITTGHQIAEILGCDFLSFGKFNFYHDCKQNQTLNFYDTDKLNKSILNLPSENTGIINKKDDKKEKLEEIVSTREEMLEKESKKLSFSRIYFLFFVILLDLLLGMSIIYPSTNPDEKFSLCMVIFIIMLNLLVISGFIPNRKKLKNESKN